ncbi:MAG: family putative aminoglycoside O-phosphotransferase [Caulobacteraceae bacterium]|nr:family putative aminoglycoside O-phosphotransferase [Caulobacteraceae bacterium]
MTVAEPSASWPAHWRLEPDGEAFVTAFGSRLAPVRQEGRPAMLKIAAHPEERDGAAVMAWWDGDGAAKVLAHEGDALLMERATGEGSLSAMARDGRDFAATLILCRAAARLHAPRRQPPPPTLKPLPMWFRALEPAAAREGGLFAKSAAAARDLLASPKDVAVLHGDLHHDNVLDFGPGGWLAIDPKGLMGERGFDYANLFYNPWPTAADPGRLQRRLALVVEAAGLEPARLLQWIVAYGGLSAAWTLESGMPDGGDPWRALQIAEMAAALA